MALPAHAVSADDTHAAFEQSVLAGLSATPKWLEPRYFYDHVGAKLFEAITELHSYYPTRTELALLRTRAPEIADALGDDLALIELGSGEGTKVRILLDALGPRAKSYVPVDIAAAQLGAFAEALAGSYPDLQIVPLAADFAQPLAIPPVAARGPRVLFFPGSTIGNMEPDTAVRFLARMRRELSLDEIVIGVDRKKDAATLIAAYDDPAGVTAAFNRNILQRINRELGATFDLSLFDHEVRYDPDAGRIEMHLRTRAAHEVTVAGRRFGFAERETIHTENSYKYTPDEFRALAERAGWAPAHHWTDADRYFSLHLLTAA